MFYYKYACMKRYGIGIIAIAAAAAADFAVIVGIVVVVVYVNVSSIIESIEMEIIPSQVARNNAKCENSRPPSNHANEPAIRRNMTAAYTLLV